MDYRIYIESERSTLKSVNEDRYMFSEFSFMGDRKIQLLAIADGMGGLSDGEHAAQDAIRGFARSFYDSVMNRYVEAGTEMKGYSLKYALKDIENAMVESVKKANREVCRNARAYDDTGTTFSAVCIIDDCAVVVNVGDSPVYYYNNSIHNVRQVTKLQTKAEQDVKVGLYDRYSENYYRNSSRLYSYLGQYAELENDEIFVTAIGRMSIGDIILVGTDGSFGRLREGALYGLLTGCNKEEECLVLRQLFELSKMDLDDDQTAIMYVVADKE